MSDVKDILGVGRGGAGASASALPPSSIAASAVPAAASAAALGNRQPREVRPPRPAGMSREAYALLDGAHPIAPSAAADALRSVSGTSSKLPGAAGAGAGAGGGGGTSASGKKGSAHKKGSAAANAAAAAAAVAKIRGRKRKKGEAVTWQLRPFENAARGDVEGGKPLKLTHWVKCLFPAKLLAPPHGTPADDFDFDAAAKQARANAEQADGEGAPYPFAAFNKKPKALRYDDDEWSSVVPPAQGWDREESDYLLDMLDRFGLRFHVVADRYKFPGGQTRTVEDLKERYYGISRALLVAREGGESAASHHVAVRAPYAASHERERKAAVELLLARSPEAEAREAEVLERAKKIEAARKAEAQRAAAAAAAAAAQAQAAAAAAAAAAAGPSSSSAAAAAAAAQAANAAPGDPAAQAAAAAAAAQAAAAAAAASSAMPWASDELPLLAPLDFSAPPPRGTPTLFDADARPYRPRPGVISRSASVREAAAAQVARARAGGACPLAPGGGGGGSGATATPATGAATAAPSAAAASARIAAAKALEAALAECGLPAGRPAYPTRAACGAWLALRLELLAMLEAKSALAARMAEMGVAPASSASQQQYNQQQQQQQQQQQMQQARMQKQMQMQQQQMQQQQMRR